MAPWGRRIPCWLLAAALAVAHVRVATAGAGDQAVIEAAPAPPGPGQTGEPPDAGNAPAVATIGPVALGLGLAFGLLWIPPACGAAAATEATRQRRGRQASPGADRRTAGPPRAGTRPRLDRPADPVGQCLGMPELRHQQPRRRRLRGVQPSAPWRLTQRAGSA